MRLLDTSKIQVVEFHGDDVPPYAILSHCWADGEVLLADLQLPAAMGCDWDLVPALKKDNGRFKKLLGARRRHDNTTPPALQLLQNKAGAESASLLSSITGIPRPVLTQDQSLIHISVASRMCWAANRSTTRVEDIAYSLLGLFDVNMPLMYGEGENAFIRLQEAILVKHDDQSLFAWRDTDWVVAQDVEYDNPIDRRLSGLLADRPARFGLMGNLETTLKLAFAGSPSAVTSKGLQVDFFLHACTARMKVLTRGADFYAVLSCEELNERTGKRRAPIIYLKRLWGTGDQFARIRVDLLETVDSDTPELRQGLYQSIFVKQTPESDLFLVTIMAGAESPDHALPPNIAMQGDIQPVQVLSAGSDEWWEPGRFHIEISDFQLGQPAAIFKIMVANIIVDVAVGLQIINQRFIRSWCQILDWPNRADNSSPAHVFRIVEEQSMLASVQLREVSVEKDRRTGALVCAAVTEHSRGRALDIFLHIGVDNWESPIRPPEYHYRGNLSPHSDLEVVSAHQVDAIVAQRPPPSRVPSRAQPHRNQLDIENLLADFGVADSVEHCRESLPTLEPSAQAMIDVITARDITKTLAHFRGSRQVDSDPDPVLHFCPIHWAVLEGNIPFLRLLLLYGANPLGPSITRLTTLHLVAATGNSDVLKVLQPILHRMFRSDDSEREGRADNHLEPTSDLRDYPLHFAAAYATDPGFWIPPNRRILHPHVGHYTEGGSVAQNSLGETPLHRAAAMGNMTSVSHLLQQAARKSQEWSLPEEKGLLNHPDNVGRTPLWHAACAAESFPVVEELLQQGASCSLADEDGLTPVHVACRFGHWASLEMMVEAGASLDLPAGSLDLLPSHLAAIFGHKSCLAILMSEGAPVTSRPFDDEERVEALHFAVANEHHECARLIWEQYPAPFEGWSLCVVLDEHGGGPVLKPMYIQITGAERWLAKPENPADVAAETDLSRLSLEE
ncbi:hypothetical protein B0H63DRAFT_508796 [Podospora didyma]|uniref:protein S-acyltransferase n=1 Tax=Podospora didyma TaxID=330526 RepID=A0AAE0U0Y6_9PEZI|nr:hypothetical protein B0H63DRAFT_508796 [Podospora didyma]